MRAMPRVCGCRRNPVAVSLKLPEYGRVCVHGTEGVVGLSMHRGVRGSRVIERRVGHGREAPRH